MGIVVNPGDPERALGLPRPAAMIDYAPTCVWPSRPVRRIAVVTFSAPHPRLQSAVGRLVGPDRWVRWVLRGVAVDADEAESRQAFDELAPWWEWADVVIADADHRSIAECVANGWVPVVGLPSARFSADARRSLDLVRPWSSRGLALHLSLGRPSVGLLESAAGMRTRRRPVQQLDRRPA
jgi:hypothetical protein